MKCRFAYLGLVLFAVLPLASCSHLPATCSGAGCGGSGTATVSFTMVADTLPAHPSILTFKVTVTQIVLTPSSLTSTTITLNPAPVVDLMRLQSDSAFLGSFLNVPSGTYSMTVTLTSPQITFFNDTSATISGCLSGQICTINPAFAGTPLIASVTINANGQQGFGLDFNLNNAISVTAGVLSVDFANSGGVNVLTAFTLPRANSNLAVGQLDLIEDFTGVVSLNGQQVTIQSATRGTLIATATSTTLYSSDPAAGICPTPSFGCVVANQVASIDAVLNNDGTLSLLQFEPLAATAQDVVEGTVVSVASPTQFTIVASDKIPAALNSLTGSLNVGDGLVVNIPAPQPFLVDTKGLPVNLASVNLFASATTTAPLRPGQTVAVHVTNFTAASGNTIASSTANTVTLRFSRFTAVAAPPLQTFSFNITSFPAYFLASGTVEVQTFTNIPGSGLVGTNYDGITDPSGLLNAAPVAVRALFFENSTNTATPAFIAAKVRQH